MIYCQTLVYPGTGAALQTFFSFKVLMTLDFPTFGYPTKPILIFFLSLWKISNCLNKLINDPFPKGFEIEDLNAMVGYDFEKCLTHLAKAQTGIKSALLINKTKCLCGQFFLICYSKAFDLVPSGSLASKTCTTTSEESNTLWSSSQIRLLCPADIRLSRFSFLSPPSVGRFLSFSIL